jgi:hypothetical protein
MQCGTVESIGSSRKHSDNCIHFLEHIVQSMFGNTLNEQRQQKRVDTTAAKKKLQDILGARMFLCVKFDSFRLRTFTKGDFLRSLH